MMRLRRPRWSTVALGVVCAVALVALVFVVASVLQLLQHSQQQDAELAREQSARDRLALSVKAQEQALQKANARLRDAGRAPVSAPPSPAPTQMVTEPGPAGLPGATGATGPQGPRGLSCIDVLGLEACRGPQGPSGAVGATGPAGANGIDGKDGAPGAQGPAGPAGPAGPKGDTGAPGKDGADGATGPPGPRGTADPGSYICPSGEYVTGFTIASDGTVTLTCAGILPPGQSQNGATP